MQSEFATRIYEGDCASGSSLPDPLPTAKCGVFLSLAYYRQSHTDFWAHQTTITPLERHTTCDLHGTKHHLIRVQQLYPFVSLMRKRLSIEHLLYDLLWMEPACFNLFFLCKDLTSAFCFTQRSWWQQMQVAKASLSFGSSTSTAAAPHRSNASGSLRRLTPQF